MKDQSCAGISSWASDWFASSYMYAPHSPHVCWNKNRLVNALQTTLKPKNLHPINPAVQSSITHTHTRPWGCNYWQIIWPLYCWLHGDVCSSLIITLTHRFCHSSLLSPVAMETELLLLVPLEVCPCVSTMVLDGNTTVMIAVLYIMVLIWFSKVPFTHTKKTWY